MKSFILNVLRIRVSGRENRARNPQQVLLSLIVRNELHLLYEDEWRLLITHETWQRARRSEERRDEWGFNLGSDQTVSLLEVNGLTEKDTFVHRCMCTSDWIVGMQILWRNLEFYFQIFTAISPTAFGHYLGVSRSTVCSHPTDSDKQ